MISIITKDSHFIKREFDDKPTRNVLPLFSNLTSYIDLHSSNITEPEIFEFCRTVNLASLEHLNISHNLIGDKAGWLLVQLLGHYNCNLSYLDLTATNVGIQTANALKIVLENNFFSFPFSLLIAENHFTDEAVCNLALGISRSKSIREIDISKNRLGMGALKVISSLIKYDSKISKINLSYNPADSNILKELVYCFCFNFHILCIDLSGMGINDDHIKMLSFYLNSPNIKQIKLANNDITNKGCINFKKMLSRTYSIQHLALEGNRIDKNGLQILKSSSKRNTVLIKAVEDFKADSVILYN